MSHLNRYLFRWSGSDDECSAACDNYSGLDYRCLQHLHVHGADARAVQSNPLRPTTLDASRFTIVAFGQIWIKKRRGLSFMFSFMLSSERQAELEEQIMREIAAEEQLEQTAQMERGEGQTAAPDGEGSLLGASVAWCLSLSSVCNLSWCG